jgi:hypothetical protein
LIFAASLSHAATIWTGPPITYTQPTPDPTQESNQDRVTPDVWLTRAASKGIFNAFYETNATALSPTNTEWAFGDLNNYASLRYTNWLAWLNGQSPTTLVGQQVVVHLISDDIYLSIQFTAWSQMGSGGFAYERSTLAVPPINLSSAKISSGQFIFNYATSPGFSYVIQMSTNLVNWFSLATNFASSNSMAFSNSLDSSSAEFFRVESLPNP